MVPLTPPVGEGGDVGDSVAVCGWWVWGVCLAGRMGVCVLVWCWGVGVWYGRVGAGYGGVGVVEGYCGIQLCKLFCKNVWRDIG